jgi:hypothetical protein
MCLTSGLRLEYTVTSSRVCVSTPLLGFVAGPARRCRYNQAIVLVGSAPLFLLFFHPWWCYACALAGRRSSANCRLIGISSVPTNSQSVVLSRALCYPCCCTPWVQACAGRRSKPNSRPFLLLCCWQNEQCQLQANRK